MITVRPQVRPGFKRWRPGKNRDFYRLSVVEARTIIRLFRESVPLRYRQFDCACNHRKSIWL
jgi:hypothetical protein